MRFLQAGSFFLYFNFFTFNLHDNIASVHTYNLFQFLALRYGPLCALASRCRHGIDGCSENAFKASLSSESGDRSPECLINCNSVWNLKHTSITISPACQYWRSLYIYTHQLVPRGEMEIYLGEVDCSSSNRLVRYLCVIRRVRLLFFPGSFRLLFSSSLSRLTEQLWEIYPVVSRWQYLYIGWDGCRSVGR